MAEVYRATDTRLGRDVVLKVVREGLGAHGPALERFQREARLAASLSHPNVVALYDVGSHDGQQYLVTELLEGQSLRERLSQGPVTVPTALDWAVQAARGLSAVHERGIVHRDLKPDNLFVTSAGHVKLLDFGIAKFIEIAQHGATPHKLMDKTHSLSGGATATGTLVGTPGYMAPEQVRGDPVDARADVFSLGAVLYEMLSGHRAFPGGSLVESGYAVLEREPDPLPSTVPPAVTRVVRRCLTKEPSQRFQTAEELALELTATIQQLPDFSGTEPSQRSQEGKRPPANPAFPRPSSPVARRRFAASALVFVVLASAAVVLWRVRKTDYFWRDPLANARYQTLTDFEEGEHSAAISRDGKLVAFLSPRGGPLDVWLTRPGTGDFSNATRGRVPEIVLNRGLRMMQFSPDGSFVSLWLGKSDQLKRSTIDTWAVPTLAGEPRRLLEGLVEPDWSSDGQRVVYHQTGPGDPTFVKAEEVEARQIYVAPGLGKLAKHAHFPTWSPDDSFIYFTQGEVPNGPLDIWRIHPTGGSPERITFHNSWVTHPTPIGSSILLYLATTADGQGPWIFGLDVERRVPHRLSAGVEQYTSLAASADGRRLVATAAQLKTSLWQVPLSARPVEASDARRIKLPTSQGRSPRLAANYLLYVSSHGATERLWKLVGEKPTELWTAPAARIIGGPSISPQADRVAFSTEERGRTRLVVMNADGTGVRILADSLKLRGAPAWAPDGQSIVTAADEGGQPRLFRISLETGAAVRFLEEYSLDPAWAPREGFLVYSGMDIGTTFPVRAVTAAGLPYAIPELTLNRGARRFRFLPGQTALVVSRGDIEHKNLWVKDLATGTERQLTNFSHDIVMGDFDVSPDGNEIVFERLQELSDIVLIERAAP
jgi:serine/threonine protein kinase/Tol biopolymer transport system component